VRALLVWLVGTELNQKMGSKPTSLRVSPTLGEPSPEVASAQRLILGAWGAQAEGDLKERK
jgi:hypothetical protein